MRSSMKSGRLSEFLAWWIVAQALFITACGLGNDAPNVAVLIDNSGSIPPEFAKRIRDSVEERARNWILSARPGDAFSIWWFAREEAPFPASKHTFIMPELKAPANRHRPIVANEILERVRAALERMPSGTNHTPLLESIHYLAATQSARWQLVAFSDLHQDTRRWRQIQASKEEDASDRAHAMLDLCPRVSVPSSKIRLYTWPGFVRGKININQYEIDREAIRTFILQWAPDAEVEFIHFQ